MIERFSSLRSELEEKMQRSDRERDRYVELLERQDKIIKSMELEVKRASNERFITNEQVNGLEIRSRLKKQKSLIPRSWFLNYVPKLA